VGIARYTGDGVHRECGLGLFCGAFAKLRKATISFVVTVCPSIRVEQLGFHIMDFYEISHLSIFGIFVDKIQVSLASDEINGQFT
jgi:hypothetical protein